MSIERSLFKFGLRKAKRLLKKYHSKQEIEEFSALSLEQFNKIHKENPTNEGSVFLSTSRIIPSLIAWYKALKVMGYDSNEAVDVIWSICEKMVKSLPFVARSILKRDKLKMIQKRAENQDYSKLKENDWKVENYKKINKERFSLQITSCPFLEMVKRYEAEDIFPKICKLEMVWAHYFRFGFERSQSLALGDKCCNCKFSYKEKTKIEKKK